MNERAFFKKIMPDEVEKINEAYCLDSDDKDLVQTGLEEIIADSYFIINSGCNYKSMVDKENDKITNLRQHFLLQYFPKTIAYIGNRFTEYKQIINPEKPRTLKEINN